MHQGGSFKPLASYGWLRHIQRHACMGYLKLMGSCMGYPRYLYDTHWRQCDVHRGLLRILAKSLLRHRRRCRYRVDRYELLQKIQGYKLHRPELQQDYRRLERPGLRGRHVAELPD